MTCHDFWNAWQARLDQREQARWPEPDPTLICHAAGCPTCRRLAERFETLEDALQAWHAPPILAASARARILASLPSQTQSAPWHRARGAGWLPWAGSLAAACLLLALGWTLRSPVLSQTEPNGAAVQSGAAEPFPPLASTLAEATRAGLELAKETSEPAARLGRVLLISASVPARLEMTPTSDTTEPPALWESVGSRVATGVRPLSAPARQAFGFLVPTGVLAQGPPPRDRGA